MKQNVDLAHLARLSCLSLSDGERERLQDDLACLLSLTDSLLSLPMEACEAELVQAEPRLREDSVACFDGGADLLRAAHADAEGYLTLPCLLGEERES